MNQSYAWIVDHRSIYCCGPAHCAQLLLLFIFIIIISLYSYYILLSINLLKNILIILCYFCVTEDYNLSVTNPNPGQPFLYFNQVLSNPYKTI